PAAVNRSVLVAVNRSAPVVECRLPPVAECRLVLVVECRSVLAAVNRSVLVAVNRSAPVVECRLPPVAGCRLALVGECQSRLVDEGTDPKTRLRGLFMTRRAWLLALGIAALGNATATAATLNSFTLKDDGRVLIDLRGPIVAGDAQALKNLIKSAN